MSGGFHFGRGWAGHRLEDECPCEQTACGLVDENSLNDECIQHPMRRGRTIRQGHPADECPALVGAPEPQPDGQYELGQRVQFRKPLSRVRYGEVKRWVSVTDGPLREGIIVGKRSLRNGTVQMEEYGYEFTTTEAFTGYLIAYDLHRSPVLVRPQDIKGAE